MTTPAIASDIEAITCAREAWCAAYNACDANAFVSHITEDVVWMNWRGNLTIGKANVHANYRNYFQRIDTDLMLSSAEVVVADGWAFDRGLLVSIRTPRDGSPRMRQDCNYLIIWQRQQDRAWKIARLIWVGDYKPVDANPKGAEGTGS